MGGFFGGPWFGVGPAGVEEVVHGWTGAALKAGGGTEIIYYRVNISISLERKIIINNNVLPFVRKSLMHETVKLIKL